MGSSEWSGQASHFASMVTKRMIRPVQPNLDFKGPPSSHHRKVSSFSRLSHTDWSFAALGILASTCCHLTLRLYCTERDSAPIPGTAGVWQGVWRPALGSSAGMGPSWCRSWGTMFYLNHPRHITQTDHTHAHSLTSAPHQWAHAGFWSPRFHNIVLRGYHPSATPPEG